MKHDISFKCIVWQLNIGVYGKMLTTVKSREHLSPYIVTREFFLVLGTFKIYSLSRFQICDTVYLL